MFPIKVDILCINSDYLEIDKTRKNKFIFILNCIKSEPAILNNHNHITLWIVNIRSFSLIFFHLQVK